MDKLVEKNNKGAHNLVYPFDTLPQPGRMLKIDNGVYWVRMSLPFVLNHINLWVLKDDMIFLKEKNPALNKAVFLRKIP